jgi:hypothetical protein
LARPQGGSPPLTVRVKPLCKLPLERKLHGR